MPATRQAPANVADDAKVRIGALSPAMPATRQAPANVTDGAKVRIGGLQQRVTDHHEVFGLRVVVCREAHPVPAGRGGRTGETASPGDEAGESHGIGIAEIPGDGVQACRE